ncbi:hypothetical protein MAP00_004542 [Monascus purpureus]|nr:hypothetical protein MAP00_004542 [Monascus purpureus]
MKLLTSFFLHSVLLLSYLSPIRAASDPTNPKETLSPCVARSPTTGLYFDLNGISLSPPELKDGEKARKHARKDSWHARGHDYGANFTINFCAPVLENLKDVVGVEKARWKDVGAFYVKDEKTYSLGQQASDPFFRGRKLVLNYTNGSPCPSDGDSRTKSTIMSFLCDRDTLASQTAVSFVGTMDSCTYFFEVRSSAACGIASSPNGQGLGPAGVFGVIALIAVAAYLIGGCAYQRTVMHQRGWRQCPNYSLWAGMFGFLKVSILALIPFRKSLCSLWNGVTHHKESRIAKLPTSRMD